MFLVFWLFAPAGSGRGGTARLMTAVGMVLPLALIWCRVAGPRIAILGPRRRSCASAAGRDADALRSRPGSGNRRVHARPPAAQAASTARPRGAGRAPRSAPPAARRPGPRPRRRPAGHARAPRCASPPCRWQAATSCCALRVRRSTCIRALNFPDGPRITRLSAPCGCAGADPDERLIRRRRMCRDAAGQAGVYMDDLPPASAPPRLWRSFAEGERGPRRGAGRHPRPDRPGRRSYLLQGDEIFRDAAHHFLRQLTAW